MQMHTFADNITLVSVKSEKFNSRLEKWSKALEGKG